MNPKPINAKPVISEDCAGLAGARTLNPTTETRSLDTETQSLDIQKRGVWTCLMPDDARNNFPGTPNASRNWVFKIRIGRAEYKRVDVPVLI